MKSIASMASLLLAASSLGACATITRGSNTAWEVNTTPAGSKVKTSNGFYCDTTPCSIKMPRRSTFTATITHEGYKPAEVQVTNRVSGGGGAGMAGNVLVGGIIGAGVDVASGAMLDLTPNPVTIAMEKDEAVIAAGAQDATIPASSGLVGAATVPTMPAVAPQAGAPAASPPAPPPS